MTVPHALRRAALAGLLGLLLTQAPASAAQSDAWITTKAKMSLFTTDDVSATAINVDTLDGVVTLHGKVATKAEKAKAEDAVKRLDGVKSVRNLLDDDLGISKQTRTQQDVHIGALLRGSRQLGVGALLRAELRVAASGAAASSATFQRGRDETTARSERTGAATRPARSAAATAEPARAAAHTLTDLLHHILALFLA